MMKQFRWKSKYGVAILLLALNLAILATVQYFFHDYGAEYIYVKPPQQNYEHAIVFGAGLKPGGKPGDILQDRLDKSIELYSSKSINSIVVSGLEERAIPVEKSHLEVTAMENYLLENGVPQTAIVRDEEGVRTFESCNSYSELVEEERASETVLLITSGYHLPRAINLCRSLGLEAHGISSTTKTYEGQLWYETREILAVYLAIWDIAVNR